MHKWPLRHAGLRSCTDACCRQATPYKIEPPWPKEVPCNPRLGAVAKGRILSSTRLRRPRIFRGLATHPSGGLPGSIALITRQSRTVHCWHLKQNFSSDEQQGDSNCHGRMTETKQKSNDAHFESCVEQQGVIPQ